MKNQTAISINQLNIKVFMELSKTNRKEYRLSNKYSLHKYNKGIISIFCKYTSIMIREHPFTNPEQPLNPHDIKSESCYF